MVFSFEVLMITFPTSCEYTNDTSAIDIFSVQLVAV